METMLTLFIAIDGEVPEAYADDIPLHEGMKKIRWFHGYAEMKNGQWVSQCKETAKLRLDFLCGRYLTALSILPVSNHPVHNLQSSL